MNLKRVNDCRQKKKLAAQPAEVPKTEVPKTEVPKTDVPKSEVSHIVADWNFATKEATVVVKGKLLKTQVLRPLEANKAVSRVIADFNDGESVLSIPVASVWWSLVNGEGATSSASPCFRSMVRAQTYV